MTNIVKSFSLSQKLNPLQIGYYLLLLLVFCLPLNKKILPYIFACIILNWVIGLRLGTNFKSIFKNKYLLLFLSFYMLHLIGILYSHDLYYGANDVLLKLSLFIFPIVIFETINYSWDKVYKLLFSFVIGCFAACIICLIHSMIIYPIRKDLIVFFYGDLSFIHHPGYFSMYLNFVNVILLYFTFLSDSSRTKITTILSCLLIVFFSVFILLLNSKTGIIVSLLIYCIALLYYYLHFKKGFIVLATIIGIGLFFFSIQHYVTKPVNPRFLKPEVMIQDEHKTIDKQTTESTSVRILIWGSAMEIIKQNLLFGVGTGDVKDVLLDKYKEKGMTGALNERLNAHDQFLQTFIALGLPGILLLFSSLVFPLIAALRKWNFIYITFLIIIFINFLTESMLETIAGVIFVR